MRNSGRKTETLSTFWAVSDGPDGLAKAVKKLQADAEAAVKAGEEAPAPLPFPTGSSISWALRTRRIIPQASLRQGETRSKVVDMADVSNVGWRDWITDSRP
jgi:hypothetical protein